MQVRWRHEVQDDSCVSCAPFWYRIRRFLKILRYALHRALGLVDVHYAFRIRAVTPQLTTLELLSALGQTCGDFAP